MGGSHGVAQATGPMGEWSTPIVGVARHALLQPQGKAWAGERSGSSQLLRPSYISSLTGHLSFSQALF